MRCASAAVVWLLLLLFFVSAECDRRFGGFTQDLRAFYGSGMCLLGVNNSLIRATCGSRPFWDLAAFPQAAAFEAAYPQIRAEAEAVLRLAHVPEFRDLDGMYERISTSRPGLSWRTFVFRFYGDYVEDNCALCPVTAALVRSCPQMYAAMFSILDPGFYIPPHRGVCCAALRYHLGVVIPEGGDCYIEVLGERHSWRNGESVLFDDTHVHHVVNATEGRRVVLFCDVLRPFETAAMARLQRGIAESAPVRSYFRKYNAAVERAVAMGPSEGRASRCDPRGA